MGEIISYFGNGKYKLIMIKTYIFNNLCTLQLIHLFCLFSYILVLKVKSLNNSNTSSGHFKISELINSNCFSDLTNLK